MPVHTPVTAATPATAENKTWVLVDLPPGHRPIGLKWVFKLKRDEQGAVVKHKARIVAKGYIQQQGIDYDEVFAPVARMESVRMLLAVAAQRGWLVHHMDVKSAFLNGELKEEVYVRQPPGFVAAGHEGKVLRVSKLYEVVPLILTELVQVKNLWLNVDAHSGVPLNHFGLFEARYYTVSFGVLRSIGIGSQKSVVRITTASQARDELLGGNIYSPLVLYDQLCHFVVLIYLQIFKEAPQKHFGEFRCIDVLVPFDLLFWTADNPIWFYQWNL
ncbi:hypothetical protein E2562_018965 [Oryza meyeriana var. granulata]|uniref:Reverse transcriptase Ty1/copia-type domain-containing protein n=1 Tax=Oryza meyeriana var. granulata TaxID=110450 RepID=A0A6G1DJS2_9ORYZ|nr:hypothetical protein E2562_018965 [Oryza meyeriana var. granulata]